jgi:hypothetical protein
MTDHHDTPTDRLTRSDNPQLTLDPGQRAGGTVSCGSCGVPVDTRSEHWTLTTGQHPTINQHGLAHDDPDADEGGPCFTTLRDRWLDLAAHHHAGLLQRDHPDGYWTLLGEDIHCGTPLQILTANGTWLHGRYEITHTPHGPRPVLYFHLGGLNQPDAPLTIPTHALLRHPGR